LRDLSRFAAFDAGCSLEVALGVKGKWKEHQDGGKDHGGQPESAHIHEIHSVTQSRAKGCFFFV
jgi:hypothetical protein